jgi:hypothetical protein
MAVGSLRTVDTAPAFAVGVVAPAYMPSPSGLATKVLAIGDGQS